MMRVVNTGMTRVVLEVGPVVVKVPRPGDWEMFLCGLIGNIREARASRMGWPELCPVLVALPGGLAVVMRRAEVCVDDSDEARAERLDVIRRANLANRCVPAELKADSWGYLDGRLVAVDYGGA